MPPAWRDRRYGEIDAWRVVWSRWWRCGFELMIDGSDMGRPRWWFNLSLWCGSVLIYVGLLGLGWFGLWVDLGMVWSGWSGYVGLGWSGWWLMVAVGLGWSGWSGYVCRCEGVEAWRRWRFDWRWFFFVWVDWCWLIWCWIWFFVWVDRYVWVDLIFLWFLMMVMMVAGWWWWLWACVREGQWESE